MRSHSSSVVSVRIAGGKMPALLTQMSMGPSFFSAASAKRDVERVSVHRRVELAGERGGGLGSAARVLVTEQQVSPCFPEAPSDRLAEASGSAGDDGGPPFQGDQLGDAAGCEDMRV
jgi:hypothetical protein